MLEYFLFIYTQIGNEHKLINDWYQFLALETLFRTTRHNKSKTTPIKKDIHQIQLHAHKHTMMGLGTARTIESRRISLREENNMVVSVKSSNNSTYEVGPLRERKEEGKKAANDIGMQSNSKQ